MNTETVLESKKGGGKDTTTIFEIQQYDHAAQRQEAYKRQAVDYGVHTVAHDPYGTLTHEVMYIAGNLPLDFDDTTPDEGAIHGAHGQLKGDMGRVGLTISTTSSVASSIAWAAFKLLLASARAWSSASL